MTISDRRVAVEEKLLRGKPLNAVMSDIATTILIECSQARVPRTFGEFASSQTFRGTCLFNATRRSSGRLTSLPGRS